MSAVASVAEYKRTPEFQAWWRRHTWGGEEWTGQDPKHRLSSRAPISGPAPVKRLRPDKNPVIPEARQLEIAVAALEAIERRRAAEAARKAAA